MVLESGKKIKICDHYRYLGVKIDEDERNKVEIRDKISHKKNDKIAYDGTNT